MTTPSQANATTPAGIISSTPGGPTWGGFRGLLKKYAGAAAGYSLRKIGSGPVVRLRRGSDSAEKDFYAGDLIDGGFLSDELCSDPNFLTAGEWAVGTGWTFGSGNASLVSVNGSSCFLTNDALGSYNLNGTNGRYFKITFTIDSMSDNAAVGMVVGASVFREFDDFEITSAGTYTVIYDWEARGASTNLLCRFFALSSAPNGSTLQVSQLSVREYQPSAAEQWALEGLTSIFTYSRQDKESAYATTWYDQSGSGNDATQATAASQPLLILAGVTNTENGKAALSFDGSDDYFVITTNPLTVLNNLMVSMVAKPLGTTAEYGVSLSEPVQRVYVGYIASGNMYIGYDDSATKLADGAVTNDQQLLTLSVDATTASGFKNGAAFSVTPTGTADSGAVIEGSNVPRIGSYGSGSNWTGDIQEIVIYPSDQTSNRTGIETNINDHYGIY